MYVHDVDGHGAGGGDEHDAALDLVVGREQALGRQVHQDPRHHPDGEHGQQGPQDLCGEPRDVTAPPGCPYGAGMLPHGVAGGGCGVTCSVPAEIHGFGGGAGGHPEGEEADHDAGEVGQEVGGIRQDGQAVRQVPTCAHTEGKKSGGDLPLHRRSPPRTKRGKRSRGDPRPDPHTDRVTPNPNGVPCPLPACAHFTDEDGRGHAAA